MQKTLLLLILFINTVWIDNSWSAYSPNLYTERVLLFRTTEGELILDGLLAHELNRTLYISVIDVFESLGFKTKTSITSNIFEASSSEPKLEVKIDLSTCSVQKVKQITSKSCSNLIVYEDEVFLSLEALEKTLNGRLEYLPFKSELHITTNILYPVLSNLKMKRKRGAVKSPGRFDPGFEIESSKNRTLKSFFLDQQLTLNKEKNQEQRFEYYSNLSTDLFQHEVQIASQGNSEKNNFTTWQIKRDFLGDHKNKYVTSYQLGNVIIPRAEFIGGPENGEGFYITNRDQNFISFGQREIEGDLRPDWEVELYVNDTLFERQTANLNGRYRFTNIPLQYGENNFRLEFYGPQGERKTEYINNDVSLDNIKKGRFIYEAGLSRSRLDKNEGLIQTSYGLSDNISTYMAFTRTEPGFQSGYSEQSVLGLNGFTRNFNYSAFSGFDHVNDGDFYALRSQVLVNSTRLQFTYIDSNDFEFGRALPRSLGLDKSYRANINTSLFGKASLFYRLEQNHYENESYQNIATQNLVIPVRRLMFLFQNDLVNNANNQFDLIYTHMRNQLRSRVNYDWNEIKDLSFEFRNRFKRESSIFLSYFRDILFKNDIYKGGYQYRFKNLFLGVEASFDSSKNYSFNARLRTSLGYIGSQNKIRTSSDLIASFGNVCVKVYQDVDNDGILQRDKDKPIENAKLRWVQGNVSFETDKDGDAFLGNLPLYLPLDIQILTQSLKDPNLVPIDDGFRAYLQRGQCKELNFLVQKVYNFEGQVFFPPESPRQRLSVRLLDENKRPLLSVRTDRDGYFLFKSLPPKIYYIVVDGVQLKSSPAYHFIDPSKEGSLEQDLYFDMR